MIYDLTLGGTSTDPYAGLDRFGRVIDSRWVQQPSFSSSSSSEEATDVERVQYGYDRASNRLWRHNVVANEQYAGENDELYAYDGLQRLIDMARGNLNEPRTAVDDASFSQNWQLDATGNWPGFKQLDVADPTQNLDQQRAANPANEITAIDRRYGVNWTPCTYDRAGNTTTFPQPVDPEAGFDATYDAWNRLVQLSDGESTIATYAYDGFNWRTKKVAGGVSRHCYYSASWQVLEKRLGTSPASADAERQFLWGTRYIDDLVLRDRDTDDSGTLDERLYALQGANWNVTAITDTIQERYRYSPYGEPDFEPREINVSDFDWESLYTGQRFDNESDLYLYRNRYYHATLGRFISRDPIEYEAGIILYEYCHSSALTLTDAKGAFCEEPCKATDSYRLDSGSTCKDGYQLFWEPETIDYSPYCVRCNMGCRAQLGKNPPQAVRHRQAEGLAGRIRRRRDSRACATYHAAVGEMVRRDRSRPTVPGCLQHPDAAPNRRVTKKPNINGLLGGLFSCC